jgi:hypothetical protein
MEHHFPNQLDDDDSHWDGSCTVHRTFQGINSRFAFDIWRSTDEGDKVDLVLKRFQAVPASRAEDNMLQKLVGRVVLAGNPFYAPANNMVRLRLSLTLPLLWFYLDAGFIWSGFRIFHSISDVCFASFSLACGFASLSGKSASSVTPVATAKVALTLPLVTCGIKFARKKHVYVVASLVMQVQSMTTLNIISI